MKTLAIAAVLTVAAFAAAADVEPADVILGQWYTEDNESIVQVTQDENKKYVGKIIWLSEPLYGEDDKEAGKPKRDRENPDKKRRNDGIVGLSILHSFKYDAKDKEWNSGKIYDPNRGKTYKCVIKLGDKNDGGMQILKIRGYIGIPALGRTTEWARVPKDKRIKPKEEKSDAAAE